MTIIWWSTSAGAGFNEFIAHVDLIGDKVWVQHDGTEEGIANQLKEAGIPATNIVLGFRIPEVRQHTGYAVA